MELFEACVGDMTSLRSCRGVLLGVDPDGLRELKPELCSGLI